MKYSSIRLTFFLIALFSSLSDCYAVPSPRDLPSTESTVSSGEQVFLAIKSRNDATLKKILQAVQPSFLENLWLILGPTSIVGEDPAPPLPYALRIGHPGSVRALLDAHAPVNLEFGSVQKEVPLSEVFFPKSPLPHQISLVQFLFSKHASLAKVLDLHPHFIKDLYSKNTDHGTRSTLLDLVLQNGYKAYHPNLKNDLKFLLEYGDTPAFQTLIQLQPIEATRLMVSEIQASWPVLHIDPFEFALKLYPSTVQTLIDVGLRASNLAIAHLLTTKNLAQSENKRLPIDTQHPSIHETSEERSHVTPETQVLEESLRAIGISNDVKLVLRNQSDLKIAFEVERYAFRLKILAMKDDLPADRLISEILIPELMSLADPHQPKEYRSSQFVESYSAKVFETLDHLSQEFRLDYLERVRLILPFHLKALFQNHPSELVHLLDSLLQSQIFLLLEEGVPTSSSAELSQSESRISQGRRSPEIEEIYPSEVLKTFFDIQHSFPEPGVREEESPSEIFWIPGRKSSHTKAFQVLDQGEMPEQEEEEREEVWTLQTRPTEDHLKTTNE